jgi:ABC-2 type transport system permease protein
VNKTLLIAKSEYLRRVRSKWFAVATLAVPLLAIGVFLLPMIAFSSGGGVDRVAVVDDAGLADALVEALQGRAAVEVSDAPLDTLRARVLADEIDGVLVLPAGLVEGDAEAEVRYLSRGGLDAGDGVRGAVREVVRRARAGAAGASPAALAAYESDVALRLVTVSESGDEADAAVGRFLLANVLSLLMYLAILVFGMMVMRGVIEEKANRIVEVIASSVRPFELMMGKVLGIGAVGLSQLLAWGALTFGLSLAAGPLLLAFVPEAAGGGGEAPFGPEAVGAIVDPGLLVAFVLFFLGGYLLYSSLFAAVGSAVDQESDAQSLQTVVILPIMIPLLFLSFVASDPDGGLGVFLSLFPLTSPILMVVRMAVTDVPVWQVALALALLAAAFVGMIALAARVYRVGILMYGKKPSLAELWRWVRTA